MTLVVQKSTIIQLLLNGLYFLSACTWLLRMPFDCMTAFGDFYYANHSPYSDDRYPSRASAGGVGAVVTLAGVSLVGGGGV
jgi:hypothetical protein